MLLTGTHPRTLDEKHRLAVPKRLRDAMDDPATLYVTPGPDRSLWVYAEAELERLSARLEASPAEEADRRAFGRLFFAQTEAVDLDKSGRVLLPERLVKFAGLGRDVILLGVRDHLEVWDAAKWQGYLDAQAAQFDEIADKAFGRPRP